MAPSSRQQSAVEVEQAPLVYPTPSRNGQHLRNTRENKTQRQAGKRGANASGVGMDVARRRWRVAPRTHVTRNGALSEASSVPKPRTHGIIAKITIVRITTIITHTVLNSHS